MKKITQALGKFVVGITVAAAAFSACADQPTRIYVGFNPGGTTDIIARMVAAEMSTKMGEQIIVENRSGASGNIAAALVAKAPADGTTLFLVPSSHATNATLYSNQPFDTEKDFAAVGLVAATPYVLVVNPSMPVHTVQELIAYLKARPGKIAYASAGPGTGQHLAGELFKSMTGVDVLHVPYKGSSAALPDVMSGRTPMEFDNITVVLPLIKSGKLRALAVTTPERSEQLPDVPTVAESGVPGFDVSGWFALLAPSKTSHEEIGKLNKVLNESIQDPDFKKKLRQMGAKAVSSTTPEKTDALIKAEIAKWGAVIHKAHITVN